MPEENIEQKKKGIWSKLKEGYKNMDPQAASVHIENIASSIGDFFGLYSDYQKSKAARNTYKTQSRLQIMQGQLENQYEGEAVALENWEGFDVARQAKSGISANRAVSGFVDASSGDRRIDADIDRQRNEFIQAQNENLFKNSFERMRTARMEALRLDYLAQAESRKARFAKSWGVVGATGNALMSVGSMFAGIDSGKAGKSLQGKDVSTK